MHVIAYIQDMWLQISYVRVCECAYAYMQHTCISYEEEDTCMPYEEEDTCMSYEECVCVHATVVK